MIGRSKYVVSLFREVPRESDYQTSTGGHCCDTAVGTLQEKQRRQGSPKGCRLPHCPAKLSQTAWLITKSRMWWLAFGHSKTCPPCS